MKGTKGGIFVRYTTDEAFKEITKRGAEIKRKRDQKIRGVLSVASVLCVVFLIMAISFFSGSQVSGEQTVYGSFVLSAETGGYVLVAVLGFALGVVVTCVVRHFKTKAK